LLGLCKLFFSLLLSANLLYYKAFENVNFNQNSYVPVLSSVRSKPCNGENGTKNPHTIDAGFFIHACLPETLVKTIDWLMLL